MNKRIMITLVALVLVVAGTSLVLAGCGLDGQREGYTKEESLAIAQQWVEEESATYTYDGFDLEHEDSRELDEEDCKDCYEFGFSFTSRQAGYGDREDQMTAQVLTPHSITVTVKSGEVTRAITDEVFDEISEQMISDDPAPTNGLNGEINELGQDVELFYYNQELDTDESGNVMCSPDSVSPVSRSVAATTQDELIKKTLNLLLEGNLSQAEKDQGLSTEFPNPDFELEDLSLENGVLTLTFTEVPGFTSGGSCRVTLLRAQVEETALQFPEVDEVVIQPSEIFQP